MNINKQCVVISEVIEHLGNIIWWREVGECKISQKSIKNQGVVNVLVEK